MTDSVSTNQQNCWSSSIAMMTGQKKIMSESGVQVKGLLTIISQYQASSHAIMKCKANKKALVRILSTFNLGNNVTMVGREESTAMMKQILP